jgi:hypothetical protein
MSDDVVKKLRDIASLRGDMGGRIIPIACTEAADEIERLREAGDALARGIRTGRWDDALDAWTEVRDD